MRASCTLPALVRREAAGVANPWGVRCVRGLRLMDCRDLCASLLGQQCHKRRWQMRSHAQIQRDMSTDVQWTRVALYHVFYEIGSLPRSREAQSTSRLLDTQCTRASTQSRQLTAHRSRQHRRKGPPRHRRKGFGSHVYRVPRRRKGVDLLGFHPHHRRRRVALRTRHQRAGSPAPSNGHWPKPRQPTRSTMKLSRSSRPSKSRIVPRAASTS